MRRWIPLIAPDFALVLLFFFVFGFDLGLFWLAAEHGGGEKIGNGLIVLLRIIIIYGASAAALADFARENQAEIQKHHGDGEYDHILDQRRQSAQQTFQQGIQGVHAPFRTIIASAAQKYNPKYRDKIESSCIIESATMK